VLGEFGVLKGPNESSPSNPPGFEGLLSGCPFRAKTMRSSDLMRLPWERDSSAEESRNAMTADLIARVEIFREGDLYVALCPDLDVSSFGETIAEAKQSVQEALAAFVEECDAMGTLGEVLAEAGFEQQQTRWLPRQPVSAELVAVG